MLAIFLALGLGLYAVLKRLTSASKAKYILTKLYMLVSAVVTGVFLIGALYAAFERNMFVAEFALTLAATTALIFGIVALMRLRLISKYPHLKHYKKASIRTLLDIKK